MYRVLCTVFVFNVAATLPQIKEDKENAIILDDDRWIWGQVAEMTSVAPNTNASLRAATDSNTEATEPPDVESETEPSYCQPYNSEKPDFSKPGRRISEEKCYEYIWELKKRVEEEKRGALCVEYRRIKNNVFPVLRGHPTKSGDYPHMGAIGWKSSRQIGTWVFKCGCSLISKKFILTAAHCAAASSNDTSIADKVPKIVRLGDKVILDPTPRYPHRGHEETDDIDPVDRNILRIMVHPQFSAPKKYFDIALMELDKIVYFSRFLQPACLWTKSDVSSLGKEATLTGWGIVESGSHDISPELLAAKVDIMDSQTCDDLLKPMCNRNWCGMKEDQLCAGKLAGGVDACKGDSGGPLQVEIPLPTNKEGKMHFVVGVISFGFGCAYPNQPGLYARVSTFIDWIEDNVWKNRT